MAKDKDLKMPQELISRDGFKSFELDEKFSQTKFGKCPIQFVFNGDDDTQPPSIVFNPKQQWDESPIEALKSALKILTGTEDQKATEEVINRAVSAMPQTHSQEHNTNVIYQSLANTEPTDVIEAMLYAKSTALYAQGMEYLCRAEKADGLCQAEFYMKSAIKLLRLHNETVEALTRYRRKGEQKVVVQHVNVNDGGKAIVGNMLI